MAKIGNQLLQPQEDWKRYNTADKNINYKGNWQIESEQRRCTTTPNSQCNFNFIGSKILILGFCRTNGDYDNNITICIDGNDFFYDAGVSNDGNYIVMFIKENLSYKEHYISMENKHYTSSSPYWQFMGIDIDKNGELKSYNPNLNKYLIKQNNQYYSIKSEFYSNGQFQPLNIDNPTDEDFTNKGFEDLQDLLVEKNTGNAIGIDKGNIGNGKYFSIDIPSDLISVNEVK